MTRLNIFSNKIELNNKIKEQENKIVQLEEEKEICLKKIAELGTQVSNAIEENKAYKSKYVNTNRECEFCYTTLQAEFNYCPKCGKKIVRSKTTEVLKSNTNVFQTEEDGDYLIINQYNGFYDKKIVIPSAINGKPVIGIWNNVFQNCTGLEEVIFEEGCKYIGKNAFAGCSNLKKVKLPKSLLEIGDWAFSMCGIEKIALPPNVKGIGEYIFAHSSLKNIILPDKLKFIGVGMFSDTPIEEIDIPQSVIHIGKSAFEHTKLKKVELPYNLYSIGSLAFAIEGLSEITIHSNVKIISDLISTNIFGHFKTKGARPTVYCAAGSKIHLFARMYGLECKEIAPQPPVKVQVCAECIAVSLYWKRNDRNILNWYKYLGISKAETWSWDVPDMGVDLVIKKYMEMEEAIRLKDALQSFIDSHSGTYPGALSPPGHSGVKILDITS